MPDSVVIIAKSCSLTIAGKEYVVASFRVTVRDNSIPYAVISIDPRHSPGDDASTATKPGLEEAITLWHGFQSIITKTELDDGQRKSNFKYEATISDGTSSDFYLTDYVLVSAGLENIGPYGTPVATVVIKHSAEQLNAACLGATGTTVEPGADELASILSSADVLDCVQASMVRLWNAYTQPGNTKAQAYFLENKNRLGKAIPLLKEKFSWAPNGAGGFPVINAPAAAGQFSFSDVIKLTLFRLINTTLFSGMVADWLFGTLAPQYCLSASPSMDGDTIPLSPFNPWAAPANVIHAADIVELSLPGDDSQPLAGCFATPGPGAQVGTDSLAPVESSVVSPALGDTFSGILPPGLPGRLERINFPDWASGLTDFVKVSLTDSLHPSDGVVAGVMTSGVDAAAATAIQLVHAELGLKVATYNFITAYRREYMVSMLCRFTPSLDTAGVRMVVEGDSGSLFSFYCNALEHSVDFKTGASYTRILGGYVASEKSGSTLQIPIVGLVDNKVTRHPIY